MDKPRQAEIVDRKAKTLEDLKHRSFDYQSGFIGGMLYAQRTYAEVTAEFKTNAAPPAKNGKEK